LKIKDLLNSIIDKSEKNENFEEHSQNYVSKRIKFDVLNGVKMGYPEIIGVIAIMILLSQGESGLVDSQKSMFIPFIYCLLKISQTISRFNFQFSFIKLNSEAYMKLTKLFDSGKND
jgi:ABC-type multidrug transport system fused ATPase/permease subunit